MKAKGKRKILFDFIILDYNETFQSNPTIGGIAFDDSFSHEAAIGFCAVWN